MASQLRAPTTGSSSFSTARAQRWILAAAIVTAMTYALRRIVEPSVSAAPPRGGRAARLTGQGSPPPGLAHWSIAYAGGFTALALLSLGAPELAGALAVLVVAGSTLTNGISLFTDIAGLEGAPPPANAVVLHRKGGQTVGANVSQAVTP